MVEETASLQTWVGEGEFPERLERLNVGAFLLWPLWALGYGLWLWLLLFVALVVFEDGSAYLISRMFATVPHVGLVYFPMREVLDASVAGIFALRANRLFWDKESRLTRELRPHEQPSISRFERQQPIWAIAGFVYIALGLATFASLGAAAGFVHDRLNGAPLMGLNAAFQLLVLLVLFVYDRVRHRGLAQS